ncbi:putative transcription factor OFP family [Helianthus debilis subsp. tardiflorus]
METPIKSKLSKIIQSTFNSCRPKNTSDVSDHRSLAGKTQNNRRLIELFSPKPQPLSSSSCKPKPHLSRLKSPATPLFPANTVCRIPHERMSKRDRRKKLQFRRRRNNATFSSITDNYYYNWWSSEEDDQSDGKTTLFSRRSVSSDSFESVRKTRGKRGGWRDLKATDVVAMDGFAVAKDSSDPYEDFRASMVDMIVEKEIFSVEELENLVECFLSLNSEEHHKVIFEVFAEIWEALITDLEKRE